MARQFFILLNVFFTLCACSSVEKKATINLGPALLNKTILGGAFGPGLDGRQWGYSVATGETGVFYAFDAISGKQMTHFELPDAGGSWGMNVAPNGDVYIGTWPNALLYRYRPGALSVECLGQPPGFEGEPFAIWRVVTDSKGNVYGGVSGSHPNDGRVFCYNAKTETFTDYGIACPGNGTVRSIAFVDGSLYAGTGPFSCRLAEINTQTGEKREILLPETSRKGQYIYDAQVIGDKLLIRTEPAKTLLVYDRKENKWVDEQSDVYGFDFATSEGTDTWIVKKNILQRYDLQTFQLTPTGFSVENLRGIGWIETDMPGFPGKSLISLTAAGEAWIYNPQTNSARHFTPDIDPQPVTLRSIGCGPDGHIYVSSYLSGGLSKYNTETKKIEQYPPGVGQAGSIRSNKENLLLGIYPSAKLLIFNPSLPFNYGVNPAKCFNLSEHKQDRVFAIEPVGEKIAMGTVATAGSQGGTLTVYDPEARTWNVYRPIPGHSVISLAYDEKKTLYCGGSNGVIFAWDVDNAEICWEMNLGMGKITALLLSDAGTLWSMTGTSCLVEIDPVNRKMLRSKCLFPNARWDEKIDALLRYGKLLFHPNGLLYGTSFGHFFSADPVTLEHKMIEQGAYLLEQTVWGIFILLAVRTYLYMNRKIKTKKLCWTLYLLKVFFLL